MVILREKDMSEEEYSVIAKEAAAICSRYNVPLAVNSFWRTASELGIKRIHLPLHILREMSDEDKAEFEIIGTSCHSVNDAEEAVSLGAKYIIAGHIFETDCKKGLAGRGTGFLRDVCQAAELPVYAIGGISADNAAECIKAGAEGICLMSGFMKVENVSAFMDKLRGGINE